MNIPKELQELRANVEELVKKYKEIKGSPDEMGPNHDDKMKDMEDLMWQMISKVRQRISYVEDGFYDWTYSHVQNHLPNPSTPSDMQMCLDNLGLAKDYDVKKRTVYANINDGKGILFNIVE